MASSSATSFYFLPKEGANNLAVALIDFESLSEYEQYREQLAADPDARRNLAAAEQSRCILVEDRSFLRRVRSPAHDKADS